MYITKKQGQFRIPNTSVRIFRKDLKQALLETKLPDEALEELTKTENIKLDKDTEIRKLHQQFLYKS